MYKSKIIGIVGGVGPYAGLELCKNIMNQTKVCRDQDHLSVAMLSFPEMISDRTAFIMGETDINPAYAIAEIINKLVSIGSEVIGIACNTSHAPEIYNAICQELRKRDIRVELVNMVDAVIEHLLNCYPEIKKIGVLSTVGCYTAKVYENALIQAGLDVVIPNKLMQSEMIHSAIYDNSYGIKVVSNPVSSVAKKLLTDAIVGLKKIGAQAVILGCTEISLAFNCANMEDMILIDSSKILADALVRASKKI